MRQTPETLDLINIKYEERDNFAYRLDPVLRIILLKTIVSSKGNAQGKVHPRTGHEGPEGE